MLFENKNITITQWLVSNNSNVDGCYTATLHVSLELLDQEERGAKFISFCTAEAMRLVKSEYQFQVLDILTPCTIFNNLENARHGIWIFMGKFLVGKDSEWLYKNKDALKSVRSGLQKAADLPFVEGVVEEDKRPVEAVDVLDVFDPCATVEQTGESKSRVKRIKAQKNNL
jgi:hypothetical protein